MMRHAVFAAGNVLLVFVLARLAHVLVSPDAGWLNALIFSIVFNAVVLPIHLRRHGPFWNTPPYGPLYQAWSAARGVVQRLKEGRARRANG